MQESSTPKIRLINERDTLAISAYLKQEVGMSGANCERMMAHWWEDNPAFKPTMPKGWVLEHRLKIVGFLANIPSKFQFSGKLLISFNPSTWYVSPDYWGIPQSRQLFHNFGEVADQTLSFITTPTEHEVPFFREQMCYFDFPAKPQTYFYYVSDYAQFLQLSSSRKAKILHTPMLPFYRYQQQLKFPSNMSRLAVELIDPNEDAQAIQDLWEQGRTQHLHTHWRDADTLRWLMSGHRAEKKELYGCFDGSNLKAFGLFMRKQEQGLEVLECLDLFSGDHQIEAMIAIIEHVIRQSVERTSAYIKIPAFHPKVAAACAELCLPTQQLNNYYLVRYGGAFHDRLSREDCYLTGIHGDYALF